MSNNEKKMVMSNEILYILLPDYAAHEAVYLSQAVSSDDFALKENPKYVNKSVAPSLEPVKSIGGFRTLPDYSFETMPGDYAALVLIGGFGWLMPIAKQVIPIVKQAIENGRIVGGNLQRRFVYGKVRTTQYRQAYRKWSGSIKTLGRRQLYKCRRIRSCPGGQRPEYRDCKRLCNAWVCQRTFIVT